MCSKWVAEWHGKWGWGKVPEGEVGGRILLLFVKLIELRYWKSWNIPVVSFWDENFNIVIKILKTVALFISVCSNKFMVTVLADPL